MKQDVQKGPARPQEPEHGSTRLNIGKIIFLITTLAVAWFVLEWLMAGK